MKRTIFVLFMAFCLCLLTACGVEEVLDDVLESVQSAGEATAQPEDAQEIGEATAMPEQGSVSSATDAQVESATASDTQQAGDVQQPVDLTTLSVEQCVTDAWAYPDVLPHIALDCPGADAINAEIESKFTEIADDPMWELHYEAYKGAERVLSVVMVQKINDSLYYTPYNLDLATGQALTGAELLELLEVDPAELAQMEQAILAEQFVYQFGTAESTMTDEEFYNGQYERTTSAENTDTERVWFGPQGQLYFVGRIYGLAGAEYYEYEMATGLIF